MEREMNNLIYIVFGTVFGIILTKSEVISWFRIRKMFLFQEPFMYLVIGSAVAVGAISVWLLKKWNVKSFDKQTLNYEVKTYHNGFLIGSLIFGIGWAITGACPGPIFAQIGTGAYPALFTLSGALLGANLYYYFKSKLPH
jgi:uncharacterized membrane protein YedE/YeeE